MNCQTKIDLDSMVKSVGPDWVESYSFLPSKMTRSSIGACTLDASRPIDYRLGRFDPVGRDKLSDDGYELTWGEPYSAAQSGGGWRRFS